MSKIDRYSIQREFEPNSHLISKAENLRLIPSALVAVIKTKHAEFFFPTQYLIKCTDLEKMKTLGDI